MKNQLLIAASAFLVAAGAWAAAPQLAPNALSTHSLAGRVQGAQLTATQSPRAVQSRANGYTPFATCDLYTPVANSIAAQYMAAEYKDVTLQSNGQNDYRVADIFEFSAYGVNPVNLDFTTVQATAADGSSYDQLRVDVATMPLTDANKNPMLVSDLYTYLKMAKDEGYNVSQDNIDEAATMSYYDAVQGQYLFYMVYFIGADGGDNAFATFGEGMESLKRTDGDYPTYDLALSNPVFADNEGAPMLTLDAEIYDCLSATLTVVAGAPSQEDLNASINGLLQGTVEGVTIAETGTVSLPLDELKPQTYTVYAIWTDKNGAPVLNPNGYVISYGYYAYNYEGSYAHFYQCDFSCPQISGATNGQIEAERKNLEMESDGNGNYRVLDAYGTGVNLKLYVEDTKLVSDGYVCHVPAQPMGLTNGSYGPVYVADIWSYYKYFEENGYNVDDYSSEAANSYFDDTKGEFMIDMIYFIGVEGGEKASGYYAKGTETIKLLNYTPGVGVADIEVATAQQTIYNLQGMKLNVCRDELPAGIYVIDGKKVAIIR